MIKLVCLNVERSKHLDRIAPFLREQKPDVLCLQELVEDDIPFFEQYAGPCAIYVKNSLHPADPPKEGFVTDCNGIFTALPVLKRESVTYAGVPGIVPVQQNEPNGNPIKKANRSLCVADIEQEGQPFRFATTHFTWTMRGEATEEQEHDMTALLGILSGFGEFILCGDLNAPRGERIFQMLANKYRDAIPEHYKTSIDGTLHRAGDIQLMVDGLFSTPEYVVSDVELHSGVSDHMAITANVT